jgi:hypothetical protein
MSKRVGADAAASPLQPVISNGRRGAKALLDIPRLQHSLLRGAMSPDAREAIGL